MQTPLVSIEPEHRSGPRRYRDVTTQDIVANIALDAWTRLLGLIADGVKDVQAIQAVGATRALVEGMLRTSKERLQEWKDAHIAYERRNWSPELISSLCDDIAAGLTVKKACQRAKRDLNTFLKLVLADPVIRDQYDTARRIRAELWADETIEIADNDSNDMDILGKGNIAAVKRADTRIAARHKLMKDFARDRFGDKEDKTQVEVNINLNHAERLEAAHARRRQLRREEAIDAEVVAKPAQQVNALPDWLND